MELYRGDENGQPEETVEGEDEPTFNAGAVIIDPETGDETPLSDCKATEVLTILLG